MIKKLFSLAINLLVPIGLVTIILSTFYPLKASAEQPVDLSTINNLQEKIAKSYASKFCNGIGMGISKEGSARLTINENKESKFNPSLWFELARSGKNNLEKVDQEKVLELLSTKIVRDCGGAIGLSGQEGIESFKTYFYDLKNEIDHA